MNQFYRREPISGQILVFGSRFAPVKLVHRLGDLSKRLVCILVHVTNTHNIYRCVRMYMYTQLTHTHKHTRARARSHTQVRKGFVEENEESSSPQPIVELVCVCVYVYVYSLCVCTHPGAGMCACVFSVRVCMIVFFTRLCVCVCVLCVCVCVLRVLCVCVCVVCVCVVCIFCVNPCFVRYRVHGGVYNSQPSIDQDVRMRDLFFRVQNVWCWVPRFNLELSSGSAGCAVAFFSGFSV